MAVLALLGFSSGMPLYLTSRTLQAWLTQSGVDLTTIGFLSLAGLPYSLKFLWSPIVDRFSLSHKLGRRRGWLLTTQLALFAAIAAMALQNPSNALGFVAITTFAIALMSATQDIVVDAYRTDIVDERDAAAGASVWVSGYRVALLVTGGLAFILADRLSWPMVYAILSLLMLVGVVATMLAREPRTQRPPESLSQAVTQPFQEFFRRLGSSRATWILAFIMLYRIGDSMVDIMSTPFLLALGFTQTQIGTVKGGVGLLAMIVGILLGGAITSRIGINRSLWVFGVLQGASNLAYWALARVGKSDVLLIVAVNFENVCYGLVTATFLAFLTSLCNPRFSATQYALLSSLMAVSRDVVLSPAGWLARSVGWPVFFLLSIVATAPGLLLLPIFAPWHAVTLETNDTREPA